MRQKFCKSCEGWHDLDEPWPDNCRTGLEPQRSDLSGPMVMRDISPYRSMITGEMIKSRSHHREHLRQHNCIEVGNERPKPKQPPKRTDAQRRDSMAQIKAIARSKGVDIV